MQQHYKNHVYMWSVAALQKTFSDTTVYYKGIFPIIIVYLSSEDLSAK